MSAAQRASFLRDKYAQDDSPEPPDAVFEWVLEYTNGWVVARGGMGDMATMLGALLADLVSKDKQTPKQRLLEEIKTLAKGDSND